MMNRRDALKMALKMGVSSATLLALTSRNTLADAATLVTNPDFSVSSEKYKVSMDTTVSSVLKIKSILNGRTEQIGLVTVDGGNGNAYGEVALGQDAMSKWAPGLYLGDTAIGYQALMNDVGLRNAASNTATGYQAMVTNIDGQSNSAFGVWSLHENIHGGWNAFFGELSGFWQTGDFNTGFGRVAGYGQPGADGHHNTGIGHESNHLVRHGSMNTALGAETGFNNLDGSGNIFIGHEAGYYETGSNHLWIWNKTTGFLAGDLASALIYGVMADNPANQSIRFNAKTIINGGLSVLTTKGEVDLLKLIEDLQTQVTELKIKLARLGSLT